MLEQIWGKCTWFSDIEFFRRYWISAFRMLYRKNCENAAGCM